MTKIRHSRSIIERFLLHNIIRLVSGVRFCLKTKIYKQVSWFGLRYIHYF